MALRTVQKPGVAGAVAQVPVAVAASDTFANDGRTILEVINGSGGSINVTITDQRSTAPAGASAFTPSVVVAVAAGVTKRIGPFPPSRFNDDSGQVTVGYSAITTVTCTLVSADS